MVGFLAWYFFYFLSAPEGLPSLNPIIVHEGGNVRLRCAATGIPRPAVEWRKLDGSVIPLGSWQGRNSSTVTCTITHSQILLVLITYMENFCSCTLLAVAEGITPNWNGLQAILTDSAYVPQLYIYVKAVFQAHISSSFMYLHLIF